MSEREDLSSLSEEEVSLLSRPRLTPIGFENGGSRYVERNIAGEEQHSYSRPRFSNSNTSSGSSQEFHTLLDEDTEGTIEIATQRIRQLAVQNTDAINDELSFYELSPESGASQYSLFESNTKSGDLSQYPLTIKSSGDLSQYPLTIKSEQFSQYSLHSVQSKLSTDDTSLSQYLISTAATQSLSQYSLEKTNSGLLYKQSTNFSSRSMIFDSSNSQISNEHLSQYPLSVVDSADSAAWYTLSQHPMLDTPLNNNFEENPGKARQLGKPPPFELGNEHLETVEGRLSHVDSDQNLEFLPGSHLDGNLTELSTHSMKSSVWESKTGENPSNVHSTNMASSGELSDPMAMFSTRPGTAIEIHNKSYRNSPDQNAEDSDEPVLEVSTLIQRFETMDKLKTGVGSGSGCASSPNKAKSDRDSTSFAHSVQFQHGFGQSTLGETLLIGQKSPVFSSTPQVRSVQATKINEKHMPLNMNKIEDFGETTEVFYPLENTSTLTDADIDRMSVGSRGSSEGSQDKIYIGFEGHFSSRKFSEDRFPTPDAERPSSGEMVGSTMYDLYSPDRRNDEKQYRDPTRSIDASSATEENDGTEINQNQSEMNLTMGTGDTDSLMVANAFVDHVEEIVNTSANKYLSNLCTRDSSMDNTLDRLVDANDFESEKPSLHVSSKNSQKSTSVGSISERVAAILREEAVRSSESDQESRRSKASYRVPTPNKDSSDEEIERITDEYKRVINERLACFSDTDSNASDSKARSPMFEGSEVSRDSTNMAESMVTSHNEDNQADVSELSMEESKISERSTKSQDNFNAETSQSGDGILITTLTDRNGEKRYSVNGKLRTRRISDPNSGELPDDVKRIMAKYGLSDSTSEDEGSQRSNRSGTRLVVDSGDESDDMKRRVDNLLHGKPGEVSPMVTSGTLPSYLFDDPSKSMSLPRELRSATSHESLSTEHQRNQKVKRESLPRSVISDDQSSIPDDQLSAKVRQLLENSHYGSTKPSSHSSSQSSLHQLQDGESSRLYHLRLSSQSKGSSRTSSLAGSVDLDNLERDLDEIELGLESIKARDVSQRSRQSSDRSQRGRGPEGLDVIQDVSGHQPEQDSHVGSLPSDNSQSENSSGFEPHSNHLDYTERLTQSTAANISDVLEAPSRSQATGQGMSGRQDLGVHALLTSGVVPLDIALDIVHGYDMPSFKLSEESFQMFRSPDIKVTGYSRGSEIRGRILALQQEKKSDVREGRLVDDHQSLRDQTEPKSRRDQTEQTQLDNSGNYGRGMDSSLGAKAYTPFKASGTVQNLFSSQLDKVSNSAFDQSVELKTKWFRDSSPEREYYGNSPYCRTGHPLSPTQSRLLATLRDVYEDEATVPYRTNQRSFMSYGNNRGWEFGTSTSMHDIRDDSPERYTPDFRDDTSYYHTRLGSRPSSFSHTDGPASYTSVKALNKLDVVRENETQKFQEVDPSTPKISRRDASTSTPGSAGIPKDASTVTDKSKVCSSGMQTNNVSDAAVMAGSRDAAAMAGSRDAAAMAGSRDAAAMAGSRDSSTGSVMISSGTMPYKHSTPEDKHSFPSTSGYVSTSVRSHSPLTEHGKYRPYRPSGSQDVYYVESGAEDAQSTITMTESTIESTHLGSDDARGPKLPASVLGTRLDSENDVKGIYYKDKHEEPGLSTIQEQPSMDSRDVESVKSRSDESVRSKKEEERLRAVQKARSWVTDVDSEQLPDSARTPRESLDHDLQDDIQPHDSVDERTLMSLRSRVFDVSDRGPSKYSTPQDAGHRSDAEFRTPPRSSHRKTTAVPPKPTAVPPRPTATLPKPTALPPTDPSKPAYYLPLQHEHSSTFDSKTSSNTVQTMKDLPFSSLVEDSNNLRFSSANNYSSLDHKYTLAGEYASSRDQRPSLPDEYLSNRQPLQELSKYTNSTRYSEQTGTGIVDYGSLHYSQRSGQYELSPRFTDNAIPGYELRTDNDSFMTLEAEDEDTPGKKYPVTPLSGVTKTSDRLVQDGLPLQLPTKYFFADGRVIVRSPDAKLEQTVMSDEHGYESAQYGQEFDAIRNGKYATSREAREDLYKNESNRSRLPDRSKSGSLESKAPNRISSSLPTSEISTTHHRLPQESNYRSPERKTQPINCVDLSPSERLRQSYNEDRLQQRMAYLMARLSPVKDMPPDLNEKWERFQQLHSNSTANSCDISDTSQTRDRDFVRDSSSLRSNSKVNSLRDEKRSDSTNSMKSRKTSDTSEQKNRNKSQRELPGSVQNKDAMLVQVQPDGENSQPGGSHSSTPKVLTSEQKRITAEAVKLMSPGTLTDVSAIQTPDLMATDQSGAIYDEQDTEELLMPDLSHAKCNRNIQMPEQQGAGSKPETANQRKRSDVVEQTDKTQRKSDICEPDRESKLREKQTEKSIPQTREETRSKATNMSQRTEDRSQETKSRGAQENRSQKQEEISTQQKSSTQPNKSKSKTPKCMTEKFENIVSVGQKSQDTMPKTHAYLIKDETLPAVPEDTTLESISSDFTTSSYESDGKIITKTTKRHLPDDPKLLRLQHKILKQKEKYKHERLRELKRKEKIVTLERFLAEQNLNKSMSVSPSKSAPERSRSPKKSVINHKQISWSYSDSTTTTISDISSSTLTESVFEVEPLPNRKQKRQKEMRKLEKIIFAEAPNGKRDFGQTCPSPMPELLPGTATKGVQTIVVDENKPVPEKRVEKKAETKKTVKSVKNTLRLQKTDTSKSALAWFIPMDDPKPWRKPLIERQAHVLSMQTSPLFSFMTRQEGDLYRQTAYHNQDKTSLQQAFEDHMQGFISRSHQRQRLVALRAEERYVQQIHQQTREQLFAVHRKTEPNVNAHPLSDVLFKPRRRNFTRKQMIEQTKKFYSKLPEVKKQEEDRKREEQNKTNRIKAQQYKQRIQFKVLNKNAGWVC